jgi:hypothetical protein
MNPTDILIRSASLLALFFLTRWYVKSNDAARLTKMARKAKNRARTTYAAAAGFLGREFFRTKIPTDGIGRVVGSNGGLKSYRKGYPSMV